MVIVDKNFMVVLLLDLRLGILLSEKILKNCCDLPGCAGKWRLAKVDLVR